MDSKDRRGHQVIKGKKETLVIKVHLELLVHHPAHPADQDLADHQDLVAVEAQ